jgi:anti-anti-sigma factor
VAEAWDAGGLYQVGSFPAYGRWAEWNGKYRDDLRRFLKGDSGYAGAVAVRVQGSPDLYGWNHRGPTASINFITCHDGFTLHDLVAYNGKHNEANGENNQDGGNDNHSWNCGWEGESTDPAVNELRHRQIKNAVAMLLLSHGVPMLLAGDEFARSQGGNNNNYCHDTALSWIDWQGLKQHGGIHRFFRRMIAFRHAHPVLRPKHHLTGRVSPETGRPEISFHGTAAWWADFSSQSRIVAFLLDGAQARNGTVRDDTLYAAFNMHWEALTFELPAPPPRHPVACVCQHRLPRARRHLRARPGTCPPRAERHPGRRPFRGRTRGPLIFHHSLQPHPSSIMAFTASLQVTNNVAKITLTGRLDASNANQFRDLVDQAAAQKVRAAALLLGGLEYMASAGLRVSSFSPARRWAPGVKIYVVAPQDRSSSETIESQRLLPGRHRSSPPTTPRSSRVEDSSPAHVDPRARVCPGRLDVPRAAGGVRSRRRPPKAGSPRKVAAYRLQLAVDEVATNTVTHAYQRTGPRRPSSTWPPRSTRPCPAPPSSRIPGKPYDPTHTPRPRPTSTAPLEERGHRRPRPLPREAAASTSLLYSSAAATATG